MAEKSGFWRKTSSHGLFTQFRHRLGKNGYEKGFSTSLKQLMINGKLLPLVVQLSKPTAREAWIIRQERAILKLRVRQGARDFVVYGIKLLVNFFRKRVSIQRFLTKPKNGY